MKRLLAFAALSLAFTGCGTFPSGFVTPKSCNDKVGVFVTSITGARDTSTTLLAAKKITVAQKQNVESIADNARSGAEIARDFCRKGDEAQATTQLSMANDILAAALRFLAAYK